ncbi:MAG TPA: IS4 family transposase [Phycisphaerae bacterium]|nr:IS4 family transposase [Phycisphaerae bacterium]
MNAGQTVFSQLMDFLPTYEFNHCVRRYRGNYRVRRFSCRDQFLCMAFAQLTYRESLRDVETCLRSMSHKLYHAGFRAIVARNTLAKANENRDWRIYADFAAVLIAHARRLYGNDDFGVALDQTVYAFDSTTIDLCLSLFPWAPFRRRKSAVKLHTLIDLRGNIPCFIHVSGGKMADVSSLDLLPIEAGSFYVMDRGYTDFERLYRFTQGLAFFIIRAKRDLDFARQAYREVDKSTGLRSDSTIRLCGPKTSMLYPDPLRRISYYATDIDKRFVFLTNNFALPALTIAQLYKCRWQVELFFKWIKQHLRIKAFYGTSINAVKTQVWIAVCVYVLVAIVKKELNIDRSMSEILQILSICLFEQTPLLQGFSRDSLTMETSTVHKQLSLFDF